MTDNLATFSCRRCGACCRWPGHVLLTAGDITTMSTLLGMSEETFIQTHTVLTANRVQLSLTEQQDGACCFLTPENTCRVYGARPTQCKEFPHTWRVKGCPALELDGT